MSDTSASPIALGTVLFTMVEPRRGHEVAYNRWYERDHFYAGCMIGAYNFAGNRYVATRDLKERRYPESSPITPDPMTGSYAAIYWVLKGHHDDWNRWAVDQVNVLHANGRMFTERDHIHTVVYDFLGSVSREEDSVPPELALDHPYSGIHVCILEASSDRDGAVSWVRGQLPAWLKDGPAGQALILTPKPLLDDAPADVPRDPATAVRIMILFFLDGEPGESEPFSSLGKLVADSGLASLVWSSPFKTTVKGTDKYTDELW